MTLCNGPANDTKLGVHILPLAFPWTLAMIRKVATILGPAALASLIRMALLVYEMQFRMILKIILKKKESRAPSIKRQAATANRI
jgi:hypothetical protein